jgi:hypothetical protein
MGSRHMDGQFQGMMSHVDDHFDHMQSTFDGQFSNMHDRFFVVDSQLDGVHSQFTDLRSHIQTIVHDPIMSRMNNMQQSFQDNMGALSSQFEFLSMLELPLPSKMIQRGSESNANKVFSSRRQLLY